MTVKFTEFLRTVGCDPADPSKIVADDKIRRLQWSGERARSESISYRLKILDDGCEIGWVRNWKDSETHNYCSKAERSYTDAEKKAFAKKLASTRSAAANERSRASSAAAKKAIDMFAAAKKNIGQSEYLDSKGLDTVKFPQLFLKDATKLNIVPIYSNAGTGDICSLQLINDDKDTGFAKRFLRDGSVKGGAYIMYNSRAPAEGKVATLVEGIATGFTVLKATDWNVIVCFSAGNLLEVAKVIAKKNEADIGWFGDVRWVVCADNDHETDGNPGLKYGGKAAELIGGRVLVPPADPGITDFNDYYVRHGGEAVKNILDLSASVAPDPGIADAGALSKLAAVVKKCHPLGYNRQTFYFLPECSGQVEGFLAPHLGRLQNLATLAPIEDWRSVFAGSTAAMCAQASVKLIEACQAKGPYDPLRDGKIRGPGLWLDTIDDKDVAILHTGSDTIVKTKGGSSRTGLAPQTLNGIYQYELEPPICNFAIGGGRMMDLTSRLHDACGFLSWRNPKHGELLAGWIVSALLSGVLPWRPHVHLIGTGGVGKTTVINDLVLLALGSFAVNLEGGSSEAGIRRKIGQSARPVVIDEFEAETDQGRRQSEEILKLMRGASSGSSIQHADGAYSIRSCFLISGINSPVKVRADRVRITELELSPVRDAENFGHFRTAVDGLADDVAFDAKLRAAVVNDCHDLVSAVKTTTKLLAKECEDARLAQQLAPMIVGSEWMRTGLVPNFREMKNAAEWAACIDAAPIDDGLVCLQTILSHRVNMYGSETTLGQILEDTLEDTKDSSREIRLCGSYGLKINDGCLNVSNTAVEIGRLLAGTPWAANWNRVLREIPGAFPAEKVVSFSSGFKSRAVAIPIKNLFGDE